LNKKIWQRFEELESQIKHVEATKYSRQRQIGRSTYTYYYLDNEIYFQWKVQVKDLLVNLTSNHSEYYKEFLDIDKDKKTNFSIFEGIKAIFLALKNDYKKGYLSSIKTLVQAEVFETQLEQAEELLKSGYRVASAVIAGTVLETALREICLREGVEDGMINKMNDNLAKKGIYNKLQQKRIVALADIRNSSAHGNADKFEKKDVEKMIREIEDFLLKYLDDV